MRASTAVRLLLFAAAYVACLRLWGAFLTHPDAARLPLLLAAALAFAAVFCPRPRRIMRKTERIVAVLDTVAPLTARGLACALAEPNLQSLRATLNQMQRDGRSRGRVQRVWELNRYQQPEQQHQGVRL